MTYYYVLNLQGDVVGLIDENADFVAKYTYNAWGEILTSSGTMASINPLRYRGYYYDSETGFYYLQSRYYDPAMHRFINADSLASTGQGIVGTNMYAYCLNNPVRRIDVSGTYSIGDIWEDFCDEIEDTVEDVCDAVSDAWEWSCGAAEDAWDWTCGAVEDAWDWTCGAVEDAWDWTCGAAEDAWDWTCDTATSLWDWTCGAAEDVWDWTSGAATDAWNFIKAPFATREKAAETFDDLAFCATAISTLCATIGLQGSAAVASVLAIVFESVSRVLD